MGLLGNSFHCGVPTYTPTNGKVDYTFNITNCP
jgi:hypothetical protein